MNTELENEIITELTLELSNQPSFNADVLAIKVKNAIREVMMKRNYTATKYTEKQIEKDLYNYYTVIKSVALYDFAQIGAPFESGHSENSTSRNWVDRDELFKGVHAFVEIF